MWPPQLCIQDGNDDLTCSETTERKPETAAIDESSSLHHPLQSGEHSAYITLRVAVSLHAADDDILVYVHLV